MTIIYVISTDDVDINLQSISNDEFIKYSEVYGQSYTPKEFETAFNDQELNTYTDQIRIITDDVSTDAIRIANAIKYIDNQLIEVEAMKGKDPHYIIGWLKQSLRIVKETLSPNEIP